MKPGVWKFLLSQLSTKDSILETEFRVRIPPKDALDQPTVVSTELKNENQIVTENTEEEKPVTEEPVRNQNFHKIGKDDSNIRHKIPQALEVSIFILVIWYRFGSILCQ